MADRTSQDIKELQESLRALEKSLTAISQKQDSQFQEFRSFATKQDSQFQELKKLILRVSPRSDNDLKTTSEIQGYDGSTEDEGHEHHPGPNSTFIFEEERGSKLLIYSPPTWKYDVFVSFRGKDTRRGFVSHLFQAFKREDINCYRDVDRNERGQKVDSMLIDAIHHSKMAIVLLSQNYADSKWCLQELVEILSWNKKHSIHGHMVLPVFYGVSSDDVKHLRGMVGKAFWRCIAKNGQHNKDIWQNALEQAGRISSWTSNNEDEAYLIQEIVEVLLKRVAYSRSPLLLKSSIVPNKNVYHLRSMLDLECHERNSRFVARTVGICGPEGIGKTTLANAACVDLHNIFEGRVILLEDIHAMETTQDVLQIQSKITSELLKDKWLRLSEDTKKNVQEIRTRLSRDQEKVLIVLDNVTTLEQVELVLGKDHEKFLSPGSRVVITSQDWVLLDKLKVDDIYMIPPLSHEDSLKLFYHYAFMGQRNVNDVKEYEELSQNIVYYAKGRPAVLESLGYSLSNAPKTKWYTALHDLVRSTSLGTKIFQCGPFGGRGSWVDSSRWDDGVHCDVRGIELVIVDSVIMSIGVTYDNYGHPFGPLFHAGPSSRAVIPVKIELDYPYEYLMAISGTVSDSVYSLTFHTNTRTLGPFGHEIGEPFYTQPTGAKIVGFFGATDYNLLRIGVYAKQVSHTYPHHKILGPFGERIGVVWDHGPFTDIRKIIISKYTGNILHIRCVYDNNGLPVEKQSPKIITSFKFKLAEVTLNYPTEFILSMSGCYEQGSDGTCFVKSLTFRTNLTTYGPYGDETDLRFSTPLELGKIVGFYGSQNISSIGAYFAPVYNVHPLATIKPFEGVFSETWDDGKHTGVRRIDIHYGDSIIYYMRFTYVDGNGGTVQGRELGSPRTRITEVINLDSNEHLVSLYVGMDLTNGIMRSVSFGTNLRKKLGPYGSERRTIEGDIEPFSFKSNIAKIVGFHGTFKPECSGSFSIGPHLQLL